MMPIQEEYEKNGISAPGVLLVGGRVHIFYQTYGNGKDDAICHAISDDGKRTFLFYQGNDNKGKTWWISNVEVFWNKDGPWLK